MGDQDRQPDATRAIDNLDEVEIRDEPKGGSPDAWIGRVLDARYRLTDVLGEGGFGFVFRAKHLTLGRDVAVKIMQNESGADPMARARFERESSMLAALAHPHIVAVSDFGVSEGMPYLVMELIEGESLRELMDRGVMSVERTLRIVLQILKALAYAHARGIVHRDLKPANVLVQNLAGEDHAKLLDFGFAKVFGEGEDRPGNALTAVGTAFGTAGYIAPEQLGTGPIDGRTDLYPAAVMIYEMISGRRPFKVEGQEPFEEIRAQLLGTPPALSSLLPDLPLAAALDPIVARGMATETNGRFASATEMARAIEELLPRTSTAPGAATPSVLPAAPAAPIPAASIAPIASADPVARAAPIARAAPARALPEIPRAWRMPIAVVLGGLVLLIVVSSFSGGEQDPVLPRATKPPVEVAAPLELGSLLLGPPIGDRPVPADPWLEPVPEDMASIRERLLEGEPLPAAERRVLARLTREQPWDARPHLLIAFAERRDHSLTNAIQEYERAYRASPSSRGDEQMLADLVMMAAHPTAGTRAGDAIETIYGREALPAIERAMAVSTVEPRVHARLTALHERLAPD